MRVKTLYSHTLVLLKAFPFNALHAGVMQAIFECIFVGHPSGPCSHLLVVIPADASQRPLDLGISPTRYISAQHFSFQVSIHIAKELALLLSAITLPVFASALIRVTNTTC